MKTHSKILLATDYSDIVMNAERYAIRFAMDTNSVITLLHVYEQLYINPLLEADNTEILKKNAVLELKKLEEHRDKLFASLQVKPEELKCKCIVREGSAGSLILKEADNTDADFIIIGTHGANGFRETYFGTQAWKVIKNASVPVLAIPQDALFTGIKNMVFATEYRGGEIPVIQFLAHLARQYAAELTILHVEKDTISEENEKQLSEQFINEISQEIDYYKVNIKILKHDNFIDALNNYCIQNKVDWLIMSPEKQFVFKKIFNRTTKKMALHSKIPLFTIPDFYNPVFAWFWDMMEVNDYMTEEF